MIDRIGHISFYVNDLEASAHFYARVFGFPEAFRMLRDDGSLAGVYLYVSDYQFLELFQAECQPADTVAGSSGGASAVDGDTGADGGAVCAVAGVAGTINAVSGIPGYAHFCLQVANLDAIYAKFIASGVPIDVEIRTGLSKCRMFWTHDPDGNKIEIMELPPESMQAQAAEKFKTLNLGR